VANFGFGSRWTAPLAGGLTMKRDILTDIGEILKGFVRDTARVDFQALATVLTEKGGVAVLTGAVQKPVQDTYMVDVTPLDSKPIK